jgi:hypothetical protein
MATSNGMYSRIKTVYIKSFLMIAQLLSDIAMGGVLCIRISGFHHFNEPNTSEVSGAHPRYFMILKKSNIKIVKLPATMLADRSEKFFWLK